MLLTKKQVADYWYLVQSILKDSLPENYKNDTIILEMMNELIVGRMQVFLISSRDEDESGLNGALFTQLAIDPWSRERKLFLFKMWSSGNMPEDCYSRLASYLDKFGKSSGCKGVFSYVTEPRLLKFFENNGYEQVHVCMEKEF